MMSLILIQSYKTIIMKKSLLILLGLVLTAGLNLSNAQEQKETKKIEKKINVENENGETTVIITEKDGDMVTEKILTGEEAEKYLEDHKKGNSYFISEDGEDGVEKVIVMEMKEGNGEHIVWVSEDGMDMDFDMEFDFTEIDKELEALRGELDELSKEEIGERLDELIEMKEELHEVHMIKMENIHQEMGEMDVTVEEKDGVMIITKTIGDTKTVEEIKIDGDNKGKRVYVISTTDEIKGGHAHADNLNMNVYPNPSDGNFTIELDLKTDETANVSVLDSNGKEVYKRSVKGVEKHELKVKLKKPSSGVYVVTVEQGDTVMKLKTIIE